MRNLFQKKKKPILAESSLEEMLKDIIDTDDIYFMDMECIDEVEDYVSIINHLLQLSSLTDWKAEAFIVNDVETIALSKDGMNFSFNVASDYDYCDSFGIAKGMNEFIKSLDKKGKIYFVTYPDMGQDLGFFFTEKTSEVDDFFKYEDEYDQLGQISDGVNVNQPG